jgi:RHS repeat-associated protein
VAYNLTVAELHTYFVVVGDRLTQTTGGLTTSYTYNDADQLTATTGAFVSSSTYDDNGNRTSVTYSSGTDTFDYDWNDRLTEATVGGSTVEYGYGPDNLRTSRTESSVTESYLWDRLTALPTMVSDGTTNVVHGPTGVANEITGSAASYPLADGLGSNRVWTNASGVATGSAEWDAWGNLRASSGSQGVHRWTGERQDPTSGLVYLRARDYSPGTGRFSQPDPIQPNADSPQGYNGYWYDIWIQPGWVRRCLYGGDNIRDSGFRHSPDTDGTGRFCRDVIRGRSDCSAGAGDCAGGGGCVLAVCRLLSGQPARHDYWLDRDHVHEGRVSSSPRSQRNYQRRGDYVPAGVHESTDGRISCGGGLPVCHRVC